MNLKQRFCQPFVIVEFPILSFFSSFLVLFLVPPILSFWARRTKYQCGNDLCAIDKEKCQKFVNLKSAIEFIKYSQAYGKKIKQFEAFKQTLRYCYETAVETIQLKFFNQNHTRKKNYLKNSAFNNFSFSFKFIVLSNIIISCCFIT